MSIKHCDKHGDCERQRLYRRFCAGLLAFILLVLLIILIVWLILRPSKPRFYLNGLQVLCLNASQGSSGYSGAAGAYLTVTLQATLAARNPNERVGIYYDRADAYAEYKGAQLTVPTALPVVYQGHLDTSVWSPFLSGADVPLPPYLAVAMQQDKAAGYVLLTVRVDGWIRWKAGAFITGHYRLRARCPALLTVVNGAGQGNDGYGSGVSSGGSGFNFQRAAPCVVDV
ncbi:NDR1/HIN1-like protein 1 [Brachypodium distachyon]|uniref:Late embryogenesis abundant protein LEA-2 subgroup domain-containing protein n=1 Tax=Brachypodium distachyon TaxID=15368 RepID=I1I096_BRADI|nr:NDR1/HIN1-like protein 1 [Brachypodium distachyon]KQJ94763.1 hypothetical protein BRADI_3g13027v3 [Brachypodium distachyon]|eukprot:XP_003573252.1 NDR1/HIN1-like protein 1 [Brachypodium distachyon]